MVINRIFFIFYLILINMKVFLFVLVAFLTAGLFIALIIKLVDYSMYKEFLSLKIGDALQQYETISYEEWRSGSEDVTKTIGEPRKIVNVSDDKKDKFIILEDGTCLTYDRYKLYEFDIIKGESK